MLAEILFQRWLRGRPEAVRKLALKYPPNTCFMIHDEIFYVIAYDEYEGGGAGVSVTKINPFEDYEQALQTRQPVCSCCMGRLDELMLK